MDKETAIKLFGEQKVRVEWDEALEKGGFLLKMLLLKPNKCTERKEMHSKWELLHHHLS